MNASDAPKFELLMIDIATIYGKPAPTDTILRLWWGAPGLPLAGCRRGPEKRIRECAFFPHPADIHPAAHQHHGRPTGDEAWAIALQAQDEGQTVVSCRRDRRSLGGCAGGPGGQGPDRGSPDLVLGHLRPADRGRCAAPCVRSSGPCGTDTEDAAWPSSRPLASGACRSTRLARPLAPMAYPAPPCRATQRPPRACPANVYAIPDLEHREAARFLATVRAGLAEAGAGPTPGRHADLAAPPHSARGQGDHQNAPSRP